MDSELDPLLERSRRGDQSAWALLVGRLQALVYSVPRQHGLSEDDAADVFIATFQALHRNLDRVGGGRALPRWVASAAARESIRLRQLRIRVAEVPLDELLAANERDAEEEAVRAEDAFRIREALAGMGSRCRRLLQALYLHDKSYTEISARLGIAVGTIGPTRARCLEKLRLLLEEEGFFG